MTRSSIWIGIGAFVLATMGTLNAGPSNGDISLSNLSVGGTPALAQLPPQVEDLLDLDIDDGPDDDGPDDDDDGPDDGADDGPDDDGDDDGPTMGK